LNFKKKKVFFRKTARPLKSKGQGVQIDSTRNLNRCIRRKKKKQKKEITGAACIEGHTPIRSRGKSNQRKDLQKTQHKKPQTKKESNGCKKSTLKEKSRRKRPQKRRAYSKKKGIMTKRQPETEGGYYSGGGRKKKPVVPKQMV